MILARLTDPRGVVVSSQSGRRGYLPADVDLLTDLAGWAGGVGVRSERAERIGHGVIAGPTTRTGRTITMGVHVERDTVEDLAAWERAASGLFSGGGTGSLAVEADGLTLTAPVVLDGEVKVYINRDYLWGTLEVPLFSPDPWLYGPRQSVNVYPPGTGVGLVYPLYAPSGVVSYGTGSTETVGVLTNSGNAEAWPVFTAYGEMPTGFRIAQDGHVIEWAGSAVGVPAVVDAARASVSIRGSDLSPMLLRDDFRPVEPGQSVAITFQPLGGGTGYLDASLASTYL